MKRGISPIISVVLLISIAVVSAVGLYFWAGGLATQQPTPATPVVITATAVDADTGQIMIVNLGNEPFTDTFYLAGDESKSCTVTIEAGQQAMCELDSVAGGGQGQGGFGGDNILMGTTTTSSTVVKVEVDDTSPPQVSDFAVVVDLWNAQIYWNCYDDLSETGSNKALMSWTALTGSDLTDFKEYRIYRNGTLAFTTTQLSEFEAPDDPDGSCIAQEPGFTGCESVLVTYTIEAVDNSGNVGQTASAVLNYDGECVCPVVPEGTCAAQRFGFYKATNMPFYK